MVAGVFCTSFTLGNPNIVFARADDIVHVSAHVLTCFQKLTSCHRATHEETFVHAYKLLNPRMNQEVVTNSYLGCVGKSVVHQDNIEHRYIEHNVTMVGNIGISCTLLSKGAIIQFDPFSGAPHEEVHGAQHVAFLKAQHAVHPKEGELQESTNPTYGQPWDEATKHAHE